MEQKILAVLARQNYVPIKPKALARKAGVRDADYPFFRKALRNLIESGKAQFGKNHTVRPGGGATPDTVTGVFRRLASGRGFVRVTAPPDKAGTEVGIPEGDSLDAATGDEVLAKVTRPARGEVSPQGELVKVLERATRQFVGTYHERDGEALVRVDGGVFAHSVYVGDPGAKGAAPDDKVVVEMLRFPTLDERGEGVITEVLGPRGAPGVDTLSVIRSFELPDEFPEDVLDEAREQAEAFDERDLDGREDLTKETVVTIDPATARDFDDAISLTRDEQTGHWHLGVHIADVGHFAPPGSALDREARNRGTSVYLPQRVIPMFPELISNGLASLQQGKRRYVKSVFMEFTADGKRVHAQFANAVIQVKRRFTYEQVIAIYQANSPHPPGPPLPQGERGEKKQPRARRKRPIESSPPSPLVGEGGRGGEGKPIAPDILALLLRMRDLAMVLRGRRFKRGALELDMPEVELEYDAAGKVTGAHFVAHDLSHQVIEEFMLAANEAVAGHFAELGVPFLRRVHPAPDEFKLKAFADFARTLGYDLRRSTDRFSLQRILAQSAGKPEQHAVHYALLRSLKQAVYSPYEEEHYALASRHYGHFTSPIRRYPDLTVHRQLGQWLRDGRVGGNVVELAGIGDHCSRMERRADAAERELVKLRLLDYLADRVGAQFDAVITGVAEYGFFAQAEGLPVEGRVHISTLSDDYYVHDESAHTLEGRRTKKRYRLGDKVRVEVVRVDQVRRQVDFRVAAGEPASRDAEALRSGARRRRAPREGRAKPRRRRHGRDDVLE
ncbi:MAG TPA: RNB domain-containing ribonuclease [Gemmataceae bacterium]|jgi:ribonuclease R